MLKGKFAKINWIFVPTNTLQIIYCNALVQPYFDYCSPLWDNCGKLSKDKIYIIYLYSATVIGNFHLKIKLFLLHDN